MKVVLFTAIGIQAIRRFWILANDFKFDIMLFLDIDKRLCSRVKSLKYDWSHQIKF